MKRGGSDDQGVCTSASVSFDSFVELHQVNCADSLFINPKTSPRHPQDIPRHPIDILQIPHRHTPICPPPPDTLQTLPQISCRHSADTPHTSPRHPLDIPQRSPKAPPRHPPGSEATTYCGTQGSFVTPLSQNCAKEIPFCRKTISYFLSTELACL